IKMKNNLKNIQPNKIPRFFVFTDIELLFLSVCIILDVSEYMLAILLLPLFGDILDLAGIFASVLMFGWVGLVTLIELVPGADILPIFIITWIIWYLTKKRSSPKKKTIKIGYGSP
ncbi:hypothetical protein MUO66_07430, partial [Candidatus Bathyarchaeota archaeon]|nr:hypothetical protein [Candidatus Bathyarchaeota archaeon]